ncbi:MAG: hypothetical protein NVS1B11_33230 [Terriglobales bacterium]
MALAANVLSTDPKVIHLGNRILPRDLIDPHAPLPLYPIAKDAQTAPNEPRLKIAALLATRDEVNAGFTQGRCTPAIDSAAAPVTFARCTFVVESRMGLSACDSSPLTAESLPQPDVRPQKLANTPGDNLEIHPSDERLQNTTPADFNREVYYRNKLEFSLDGGWLPINIPFPLDVFVGDVYNTYPLKYTLVPIIASLRWHVNDVGGPVVLRGNWDLTLSGSVTAIPGGPESRYFSYIMGIRRNFVPRNWKFVPYFDTRLGLGNIDAKGPVGVPYAQGEDFTFTVGMGSGVRYNFNSRYAVSAGLHFMHISNLDLSEGNGKPSWGVRNYGINVYGPMFGIDIQLRRHRRHSER